MMPPARAQPMKPARTVHQGLIGFINIYLIVKYIFIEMNDGKVSDVT
jgi:hypothetical protein